MEGAREGWSQPRRRLPACEWPLAMGERRRGRGGGRSPGRGWPTNEGVAAASKVASSEGWPAQGWGDRHPVGAASPMGGCPPRGGVAAKGGGWPPQGRAGLREVAGRQRRVAAEQDGWPPSGTWPLVEFCNKRGGDLRQGTQPLQRGVGRREGEVAAARGLGGCREGGVPAARGATAEPGGCLRERSGRWKMAASGERPPQGTVGRRRGGGRR